jgi:predicted nucleotidyltransferase
METLVESKRAAIAELSRRYRVRQLELFGSAIGDKFDPETSDLDFLVDFETIPPGEHARCYFGLLFALEELLGRHVDLVETAAIRNPYFLLSIAKDRVLLYRARSAQVPL